MLDKDYMLKDPYLFKGTLLYIFVSSFRDLLILELHAKRVAGHFKRYRPKQ